MSTLNKNIALLTVVQIAQFVVPLLQLPYLTRVMGVDGFASYIYALSLLQFLSVFIDYGLGVYLPQKVALSRNDNKEMSRIFTATFLIKSVLSIPAVIGYFAISAFYSGEVVVYFFAIMAAGLVFNGLSLVWLYQGLESIKFFAGLNLTIKLVGLFFVINLVESDADLILLAVLGFAQFFLLFVFSLIHSMLTFEVRFVSLDFRYIRDLVDASFGFFVSRIFAAFYTSFSSVFLGVFGGAQQVALFGAAEQFYKAAQQVFFPFSQALYPYMVRTKNYKVFKKILIVCFLIAVLGAAFGLITSSYLLNVVFGASYAAASEVLDLFMLTIVVSSVSLMMGYPALAPLGLSNKVNLSVVLGGLVQLIMLCALAVSPITKTAEVIVVLIFVCEIFVLSYRGYSFYQGFSR